MSDVGDYFAGLARLCEQVVAHGHQPLALLESPPATHGQLVSDLIESRRRLLNASDYARARGYLETGLFGDMKGAGRVAAFVLLLELEEEVEIALLRRSCETYRQDQTLFKELPSLWSKVRQNGSKPPDLVWIDGLMFDASGQLIEVNGKVARIDTRLRPHLASWLRDNCKAGQLALRIDPYAASADMAPLLLEYALRPADPTWWSSLRIWPGNRTASSYELRICDYSEDPDQYWEYRVSRLGRLEVTFSRDNSGLLRGMIEELPRELSSNHVTGLCLHFDSTERVGTEWDDAVTLHIDGAVNVYEGEAANRRLRESLANGKVQDATFRTHLFRADGLPLKSVVPVASRFFRSRCLLRDWFADQFRR